MPLRQALRFERLNAAGNASMKPGAKPALWCDPVSQVGCAITCHQKHPTPLSWPPPSPNRSHVPVVVAMAMIDIEPPAIVDQVQLWHHYCVLAIAALSARIAEVQPVLEELNLTAHARMYETPVRGPFVLSKILFLLRSMQLEFTWDRVLFAAGNEGPFRHGLAPYLLSHTGLDVQDVKSTSAEALDSRREWEEHVSLGTASRFVSPSFALVHGVSTWDRNPDYLFDAAHQRCSPFWNGVALAGLPIGTSTIAFEGMWLTWDDWRLADTVLGTEGEWPYKHLEHIACQAVLSRHTLGRKEGLGLNTAHFFFGHGLYPSRAELQEYIATAPPHVFTVKRISKSYEGDARTFLRERRGGNIITPGFEALLRRYGLSGV